MSGRDAKKHQAAGNRSTSSQKNAQATYQSRNPNIRYLIERQEANASVKAKIYENDDEKYINID